MLARPHIKHSQTARLLRARLFQSFRSVINRRQKETTKSLVVGATRILNIEEEKNYKYQVLICFQGFITFVCLHFPVVGTLSVRLQLTVTEKNKLDIKRNCLISLFPASWSGAACVHYCEIQFICLEMFFFITGFAGSFSTWSLTNKVRK